MPEEVEGGCAFHGLPPEDDEDEAEEECCDRGRPDEVEGLGCAKSKGVVREDGRVRARSDCLRGNLRRVRS